MGNGQQQQGGADAMEGFNETVPSAGRNYVQPGKGVLKVERVKRKTASEAFSGKDTFIVEMTVVEHELDASAKDAAQMLVGESCSYVVTYNKKYPTMYHSDIKKFIGACDGTDPAKVTIEMFNYVLSEEQPLAGTLLRFFAKQRPTDGGGVFTNIEWKPYEEKAAA